jgi:hypothetical protein
VLYPKRYSSAHPYRSQPAFADAGVPVGSTLPVEPPRRPETVSLLLHPSPNERLLPNAAEFVGVGPTNSPAAGASRRGGAGQNQDYPGRFHRL